MTHTLITNSQAVKCFNPPRANDGKPEDTIRNNKNPYSISQIQKLISYNIFSISVIRYLFFSSCLHPKDQRHCMTEMLKVLSPLFLHSANFFCKKSRHVYPEQRGEFLKFLKFPKTFFSLTLSKRSKVPPDENAKVLYAFHLTCQI
jgi:hypothetical protein